MAIKNILLAIADSELVTEVNEALGTERLTMPVSGEADALALLETGEFDALMADFNLGSPDASELLNAALEKCPETKRFVFAYEADLALIAAKVLGDHEILPKPVEAASLKSRIEKALDGEDAEVGTASGFDTASSIPPIYAELIQALESPGVICEQVGEMIARDDRMIQEILTLTRSAYFGVPRNLTEPVDAVEALGLDTMKALVKALQFLAEHSHVRPGYLSLEKIWQHSINVGRIARDLVLFETKDRTLASQALAAGLLHDLGKVVLATNFDDLYGRVHSLARKQPVALWDIEREMFGANHGEIGACLLGMWNLPAAIVDAAAHHHEPPLGESDRLTPLAAVHIANVIEHQLHPSEDMRVVPVVNTPFLNELGLLQRLPIWRATFANQLARAQSVKPAQPESVAPESEAAVTSQTANELPGPVADTWTATDAPATDSISNTHARMRLWIYTGVVAAVILSLSMMVVMGPDSGAPIPVRARKMSPRAMATVVPATPPVTEAAPLVASTSPGDDAMAQSDISPLVPEPVLDPSLAESEPPLAPSPDEAAVVPVVVEPKLVSKPAFRLNGISYSASKPAAFVNGETVFVGDQINGATVINIKREEITLEINGERKTLSLPSSDGRF